MKHIRDTIPLDRHAGQRPSEQFREYCTAELEHRRNAGAGFDEVLFQQAVELVVRKLQTLEAEGRA